MTSIGGKTSVFLSVKGAPVVFSGDTPVLLHYIRPFSFPGCLSKGQIQVAPLLVNSADSSATDVKIVLHSLVNLWNTGLYYKCKR